MEKIGFNNTTKNIILSLVFILSIELGICDYFKFTKREREYIEYATPLCQKVMREFDENKNNILEPQEGDALAKAVGYSSIIPTSNILVRLDPEENYSRKLIRLTIKSGFGDYYGGGPFRGSSYTPSFNKRFCFPLSELEQLAKSKAGEPA